MVEWRGREVGRSRLGDVERRTGEVVGDERQSVGEKRRGTEARDPDKGDQAIPQYCIAM